jgi:hypothetical protein
VSLRRMTITAAALVCAAAFAAPAQADLAVTGPLNPLTGFPAWYQDSSGTQLELCIADPLCPSSPAAADFVGPDGEAFWMAAGADLAGPAGQSAVVEFAVEAAFLDAATPISFGRIQVTLDGMEPNSTYTVTHPYGVGTWTTNELGRLVGGARAAQRHEVGCAAGPCDFNAALGTEIGPFMTWDPAEATPPAGYIGDGITPHGIAGPATTFVRVEGPGLPPGGITTNEFTVEGKLASAPTAIFFAAPGSGTFGTQRVGTTATRTITVKNNGLAAMAQFTSVGIDGADAASFAKGADGCTGATLSSGQTCTVDVGFTPGAGGAKAANLVLTDATGSHAVPLSGSGGAPGIATNPGVVNFFNQPVTTTSTEQLVTIGNTGDVSLNISGASIAGPNAGEFGVSSNHCSAAVAPGANCTIGVRFLPAAAGTRNASLVVTSDGAGSPHSIPLTGNGTGTAAGAAGGASQGGASLVGTSRGRRLALGSLRTSARISRARLLSRGLTLRMSVPRGTRVLRLRILRGSRVVWTSVRSQRRSGRVTLRLNDRRLRRLATGRYTLEVRPGRSARSLGSASRARFVVTR